MKLLLKPSYSTGCTVEPPIRDPKKKTTTQQRTHFWTPSQFTLTSEERAISQQRTKWHGPIVSFIQKFHFVILKDIVVL